MLLLPLLLLLLLLLLQGTRRKRVRRRGGLELFCAEFRKVIGIGENPRSGGGGGDRGALGGRHSRGEKRIVHPEAQLLHYLLRVAAVPDAVPYPAGPQRERHSAALP